MRKTNTVKILEQAQFEIRETRKWYNKIQNGLGKRFLDDAKSTIYNLAINPLGFQIRYKSVRMAHLYTFPYSIHFEIIDNEIIILAVMHAHINPEKWM